MITQTRDELITETKDLIAAVYKYNSVGANCHIVIDDDNYDDDSIRFCLDSLAENIHESTPEQIEIERKLLNNLLILTENERENLVS